MSNDPWAKARAAAEKRLAAPPPEPAEEDADEKTAARDGLYDALSGAVDAYKAAKGPAEKRTFQDAGLAARGRIDRERITGEIVELADSYLKHYPDMTAEQINDWYEDLSSAFDEDDAQ